MLWWSVLFVFFEALAVENFLLFDSLLIKNSFICTNDELLAWEPRLVINKCLISISSLKLDTVIQIVNLIWILSLLEHEELLPHLELLQVLLNLLDGISIVVFLLFLAVILVVM